MPRCAFSFRLIHSRLNRIRDICATVAFQLQNHTEEVTLQELQDAIDGLPASNMMFDSSVLFRPSFYIHTRPLHKPVLICGTQAEAHNGTPKLNLKGDLRVSKDQGH